MHQMTASQAVTAPPILHLSPAFVHTSLPKPPYRVLPLLSLSPPIPVLLTHRELQYYRRTLRLSSSVLVSPPSWLSSAHSLQALHETWLRVRTKERVLCLAGDSTSPWTHVGLQSSRGSGLFTGLLPNINIVYCGCQSVSSQWP